MSDPILRMSDITKDFSGVRALDSVSVHVERGEVHGIVGENGAGKSTLMKVLSGVYPHGSYLGQIDFDGEPVAFKSINDSEHAGIVIIHQELALSPYLSVAENLFLGNERASRGVIDWHQTNEDAQELLHRVGLKELPTTPVMQLGVGKQQLVEIAKALSKEVKLLILDEPTAALNDEDSEHLLELIRGLRDQGITSIIISHKLAEIRAIADSVTVLRDGKTVDGFAVADEPAVQARMIRSMVGRELDNLYPEREARRGEELMRVEQWSVHHPLDTDRVVIDEASFSVHAGEVVGFAGLMGAGRTELAMSLFGRQYGSRISGQIYRRGEPVTIRSVREAISHGIAYVTEDRKKYGLNLIASIAANVSGAAIGKVARRGVIDLLEEIEIAESYRDSLRIRTKTVATPVANLSGGNQQKVVLSKWLFTGPEVLILDEPTRGVDVGAKFEIYEIINSLAAQDKAIIIISSELPELLGTCDRIYTISEGRLTGEVPRAEATQERLMHLMTLGKE